MKIHTLNKRENKNLYDALMESNGNERFLVGEKINTKSGDFYIESSKRITSQGSFPILYRLVLSAPEKLTFYSPDGINFLHVFRIERKSLTKIEITSVSGTLREFGYPDAETCLNDYVIFNRMWRESASGSKKDRLKY